MNSADSGSRGCASRMGSSATMRAGLADRMRMRSPRNTASSRLCVTKMTVRLRCAPDVEHLALHAFARRLVEADERLVHEDEVGVGGKRARDGDALLHAARDLMRIIVLEAGEPDDLDDLAHLRVDVGAARALDPAARSPRCRAPSARERSRAPGTRTRCSAASGRRARRRSGRGPREGFRMPASMSSSVVLPHPDGPQMQTNSFAATLNCRSSCTTRSP